GGGAGDRPWSSARGSATWLRLPPWDPRRRGGRRRGSFARHRRSGSRRRRDARPRRPGDLSRWAAPGAGSRGGVLRGAFGRSGRRWCVRQLHRAAERHGMAVLALFCWGRASPQRRRYGRDAGRRRPEVCAREPRVARPRPVYRAAPRHAGLGERLHPCERGQTRIQPGAFASSKKRFASCKRRGGAASSALAERRTQRPRRRGRIRTGRAFDSPGGAAPRALGRVSQAADTIGIRPATACAMRALLVHPEFPTTYWGFQHSLDLIGKRATLPPLGLISVAALLPPDWDIRLVDMNVRPLEADDVRWSDVVLTGGMLVQ